MIQKLINKILLLCCPIIVIMVDVNYFGDVSQLFQSDYPVIMAQIINSGKNVTNISYYDERLFEKDVIAGFKTAPDVLILGSSRTMAINKTFFKESEVFNSSVSSGSIEDLVATYQLYKLKHLIPKTIILNIDPWIFNENSGFESWKSIKTEYFSFVKEKKLDDTDPLDFDSKYFQLLSPSYFQKSLRYLTVLLKTNRKPVATTEKFNVTNTKLTDGSIVYSKAYREQTSAMTRQNAENFIKGDSYGIEHFNTLSKRYIKLFYALIEDFKQNHINIKLYLSPYHPLVYQLIQKKYPLVNKTENFILTFAKKNNIEVIGSFNPQKLGFDESYFYDGIHLKEMGIQKIFPIKKF